MPRKLAVLAIALFALSAAARTRAVSSGPMMGVKTGAATVYGTVTSVDGNVIGLAGGLVTIDATDAKIIAGRGRDGTMADVAPGAIVFATLRTSAVADGAPLPAEMIAVTRIAGATLFGAVDRVDVSGRTLTLLGRTVHVTNETSFGGLRGEDELGLEDVLPDQLVQVETEADGARLVATSVIILTPIVPQVRSTRGAVKSIGTSSWVIEQKGGQSLTLLIDAQTKIAGSPKVGDEVEVLYRIDSSNANVAIAIVRFEKPSEPQLKRISGRVERIEPSTWTIAGIAVKVTSDTKIQPGIRVGDSVEVLAESAGDGSLTAILIVKKMW